MLVFLVLILIMIVVMVVMMCFFLFFHAGGFFRMLFDELLPFGLFRFDLFMCFFHERKREILCILHDFQDTCAGKLVPGRRQDTRLGILFPKHRDGLIQLLL